MPPLNPTQELRATLGGPQRLGAVLGGAQQLGTTLLPSGPRGYSVDYAGIVERDGTMHGPNGWTVAHPAIGKYTVTHNLNLDPLTYTVVICSARGPAEPIDPTKASGIVPHVFAQTANSFTVYMGEGKDLTTFADAGFNFTLSPEMLAGDLIPGPPGPEGEPGEPGPPGPEGIPLIVNGAVIGDASSGGSAGAAILTGTFAALPASPSGPTVYYFTDSVYSHAVYESGAWKYFYGGFRCIPPVDAEFAWVNQGTATVTGAYGGVYMDVPPVGAMNIRIRKKAAPATPYAIHAAFMPNLIAVNFSTVHLGFRNAAGGFLMHLRYGWFNGWHFDRCAGTPTVDSTAGFIVDPFDLYRPFHFRIADNGTNTTYSYSLDGRVWVQLLSEPRGTFLTTPDEVWWGVDNRYAAGGNSVGAYLIHWAQS